VKIKALEKSVLINLENIISGWTVTENNQITKKFNFNNFRTGLEFVNIVGDLAESLNHHPEITLNWKNVTILTSTHQINSLSELDIELARRIDNSFNKFNDLKGQNS